jgi:hypothetical protein
MLGDWIYVPRSREYALPWLLGPAVSMALALFGLPAGKPPEFTIAWRDVLPYAIASVGVMVLNALIFWTHVRTQFLTWSTGRKAFLGTFLFLTILYFAIFGVAMILTGQAIVSFRDFDLLYTARCVLAGACSMLPALLVSAVWKSEEPGVTTVRLQRQVGLDLLRRLRAGSLPKNAYRTLLEVLEVLPKSARTAQSQLPREADRTLGGIWAGAAESIHDALREMAMDDFYLTNIRQELEPTIAAAQAALEQER